MLASIVEDAGLVTVIGSPQNDAIVITTTANPRFTDISVNAGTPDATFGRFRTSSISNILVFAGAGNDSVFSSSRVSTELNGQAGNDVLNGGFADDIIRGSSGNDRIVGGGGNDRLVGGGGADAIFGGSGNDTLLGQGGVDRLFGQAGGDFINAGDGNDRAIGGNGRDRILGGGGNDFIAGNAGNDELFGNLGDDSIHGGPGNDLVAGREGDDSLFGDEGNDIVNGFTGNDLLLGQDGNDTLDGGEGIDRLIGGAGEDFLEGGFDAVIDRINGGADNDTIVRREGDVLEDVSNGNGFDSVLDFSFDNDTDDTDEVVPFEELVQSFRPEAFLQVLPPPEGPAFSAIANTQFANFPFVINPLTRAAIEATPSGTPIASGDAYNCHSHAWHNRQGEAGLLSQDPNVSPTAGSPRWDNSAIDDMQIATRLNNSDTPQVGDVVVYGRDINGDGFINTAREAGHSALVTRVVNGQITEVQSKLGQAGEINHHPNDPLIRSFYGNPTFIFRR